jgi:DNA-binding NarL/FixJ family response regulator
MTPDKIKVLIFTPYPIYCEGMCSFFQTKDNLKIVGRVLNPLNLNYTSHETPDVIIIDIDNIDTMNIISNIKIQYKDVKIIPISDNIDKEFVSRVIKNGCCTFLKKDVGFDILYDAIMSCYHYNFYVNNITSPNFFQELNEPKNLYNHPIDEIKNYGFFKWWERNSISVIKGITIGFISGILICIFLFLMFYFKQ